MDQPDLRWIHVITAIAWIGSSFYFIHLDLSLKKRDGLAGGRRRRGMAGPRRRLLQHAQISCCAARTAEGTDLVQVGELFHLDHAASSSSSGSITFTPISTRSIQLSAPSSPGRRRRIGIGGLAVSWFVYEGLCRSPLGRNGAALGVALFVYILARRLRLHPGLQRPRRLSPYRRDDRHLDVGQRLLRHHPEPEEGRGRHCWPVDSPDPKLGKQAKQRSTHNNYLTLPVIFLMLSNHYPLAWSSRYAVGIIGLIVIAGAVIRHFFNSQHAGKGSPWWTWAVAALCIWPSRSGSRSSASPATPTWPTLRPPRRRLPSPPPSTRRSSPSSPAAPCAMRPSRSGTASSTAPKGVRLDTPEEIARHAEIIRIQSVLTHAMPPNNITEMTLDERKAVATWLAPGRRHPLATLRLRPMKHINGGHAVTELTLETAQTIVSRHPQDRPGKILQAARGRRL